MPPVFNDDGDGGVGIRCAGVLGVSPPLGPGNKRLTMDFRRFLFLGGAVGKGTVSVSGISKTSLLNLDSLSSGNCKRIAGTAEAACTMASMLPPLRWLEDV